MAKLKKELADVKMKRNIFKKGREHLLRQRQVIYGFMKGTQYSTVAPVFATLTPYVRLHKVNTIGLAQPNRCIHRSAIAYNLRKHLKCEGKWLKIRAGTIDLAASVKNILQDLSRSLGTRQNWHYIHECKKKKAPSGGLYQLGYKKLELLATITIVGTSLFFFVLASFKFS